VAGLGAIGVDLGALGNNIVIFPLLARSVFFREQRFRLKQNRFGFRRANGRAGTKQDLRTDASRKEAFWLQGG